MYSVKQLEVHTNWEANLLTKQPLKWIRYLVSLGAVIFAICIFVNPFERLYIGLMSLNLSLVMLVQFFELKESERGPRRDYQMVVSLIACAACLASSLYAFSTL